MQTNTQKKVCTQKTTALDFESHETPRNETEYRLMFDETNKVHVRAQQALDAAISAAHKLDTSWQVHSRLEEITLHFGRREGIYANESDPECGVVATGNWNTVDVWDTSINGRRAVAGGDLPARLCTLFEKLGIPCEWSDEWTRCCYCGRLLHTSPGSWDFKPYYHNTDDGAVCFDCEPEHKFPDTIAWLVNHDACSAGKNFVGNQRTLAEAVMDPDASDSHLQWLWDELRLDNVHGFERTRELLRGACIEKGI